jgi:release factor glutamine methyltransferase
MLTERGAVMTIFEAYNNISKRLSAAGIDDSSFEARAIIRHITGLSNAEITANPMRALTEFQENNITAILRQREIRYPLQYIFGTWDFYKYKFKVGVGVLIPRSDTEILVETASDYLKDKQSPKVLDLCAGSGCIGISLAKDYPDSAVVMLEKYEEAARYINQNIELNSAYNTMLLMGDALLGDGGVVEYDLIVSNPPYIPQSEIGEMNAETKFEPETALLCEGDGLLFYKTIAEKYKTALKDGGMLAFEVGFKQANAVADILKENGYKDIKKIKDYNGIERVVCALK